MLFVVFVTLIIGVTGCRKPYDTPEYKDVENNETAFVIPLEGKVSEQAKFASEEYLLSKQVATKRVQVLHRWNQTGRRGWVGEWIPMVKVLTVNRAPITTEWTASAISGTSQKDQAIWVESKDSVGFSIGFNCTAYIEEENAALFLYKYSSSSLQQVMDTEIRARVQSAAAESCAKYDLDELRAKKDEIIQNVRTDVIPFFKGRGITVTTIGMFGGFTYENPTVQEAIDEVFRAQQLEDVAEARRKAAEKEKLRIEIEADAEAARITKVAVAEAEKIRAIAKAVADAQQYPLFLELKKLEVESDRIIKWNGSYPQWYMGQDMNGSSPGLLMNVDITKTTAAK